MGWKTVVITKRAKLDFHLNHLVVRSADTTTKIFIGDISTLIIETTAVSLTAFLLNELIKQKVKIIFCDEKRLPSAELMPFYGSHDTSDKIKKQINWKPKIKTEVWTRILAEKIKQQAFVLEKQNLEQHKLLKQYIDEIELNDKTNREGHAAKVYFNALFGKQFSRNADIAINAALNYGYAILLSAFSREITANGYLTQLGIGHENQFNHFNFACDIMEPFRPLVDLHTIKMKPEKFDTEEKHKMVSLLEKQIFINNTKQYLPNAIRIYSKSIFDALNESDVSKIRFYKYEL
ncbi:MAG: type II CRISPR-associated endonuclease Cas1 [Treponemataceae bacterium]